MTLKNPILCAVDVGDQSVRTTVACSCPPSHLASKNVYRSEEIGACDASKEQNLQHDPGAYRSQNAFNVKFFEWDRVIIDAWSGYDGKESTETFARSQ